MSNVRRALFCLGLLALLASCTSSREADPGPASGDFAVDYCRYLSACGSQWLSQFPGGTEQDCREVLECGSAWLSFPSDEECPAGADQRCELLGGVDCSNGPKAAGNGEACAGQCQSGLFCDYTESCPVCRPAVGIGAPCHRGLCEDEPGGTCDPSTAFCDLQTDTCRVRLTTGEVCSSGDECQGRVCVDGVCGPRHAEGTACEGSAECLSYLACIDGTCAPRSRAGEPCGGESFNVGCQQGLFCMQGKCEAALCALAPREVGSPCRGYDCGPDLYCAANQRCARPLELGAACEPAQGALGGLAAGGCGSNAYCSAEGRCVPALGEGEACGTLASCGAGLSCLPEQGCDFLCGCEIDESTPLVCRRFEGLQSCD